MISAEKLYKNFGPVEAVKHVSFEIEKGEIVGFLGSNAAGKTTTMRILTCYFPPTSGSARVAGYDIFTESLKVRKNVGYLPENVPLYTDMPVNYFLDLVASLKGLKGKERGKKVDKAIQRCNLNEVKEMPIGKLSKGFRQRVGIAQAIITDPPVLILDEPTVGLDPKQIIEIRSLIKNFGGKSTVILSSHNLHEIEKICSRILIIDRGEILAFDTPENLAKKIYRTQQMDLCVEGPTEKVKAILKDIKGVEKIADAGKKSKRVYNYQLKVSRGSEVRRVIFEKIAEAGYKILEMSTCPVDVEDIFRKIVPDKPPLRQSELTAEEEPKQELDIEKKSAETESTEEKAEKESGDESEAE